jgi:hypothetical protein
MIGGVAGMVMGTPGYQFSEGVRIHDSIMTERFSLMMGLTVRRSVHILSDTHYILQIMYTQL